MDRFPPAAVIVVAALLAGGLLRAATAFPKPVLYHDESHSYQAATGHVGEAARVTYDKQPPYGRWVPAADWKRLLRPERPFCFVTISRDALRYESTRRCTTGCFTCSAWRSGPTPGPARC